MQISPRGLALIKSFEGFSAKPYRCPAGRMTIGYGHIIRPYEHYIWLSEDEALRLLAQDTRSVVITLNKVVNVSLTAGQFDALCSLVYNWGISNFLKSTGLKYLNKCNFIKAKHEFFSKEQGVVTVRKIFSQGLYNRRQAELKLWESDK